MIIPRTFTMARWQIVVKKSKATKQTKDQNYNNNNTHKNGRGRAESEKANVSDVIVIDTEIPVNVWDEQVFRFLYRPVQVYHTILPQVW